MISKSLKETEKIAQEFLNKISAHTYTNTHTNQAVIVGLFGDLGSGKTTFTQALGKLLGVQEVMTSPTFVLEKFYLLDEKINFNKLIHIDAYRLDSGKELLSLKFEEMKKDPNNLILIEWPERVADILPTDIIKINFKFVSENEREIEF
ncbi:MAG: tRNA (adenosine(37)-N6)-threonylcarbamoyltransferase complex ATPase subunit type 1 TsaE [Candidatus Taylorbacteria bacterium RIFOXYD2_FULL_36_9]|uniref:tRNA threonylcarbamoyladenosine biosynthesis protein TsaE n=1 Tax=Candidatus Taylorbacteria bacterium RIFOXYD2_FULL_36_9 TaxID=1802338 RepID=A0A1G2PG79_9BACT|nr:MAG: tRNA (adenosine(37)-N6)-threonylcarbamoyltransferase complex ATPase subunit type 1 TsaE [Candidatus Taylorbacteria bacterium RIFOXYD2_FULL_36_9]